MAISEKKKCRHIKVAIFQLNKQCCCSWECSSFTNKVIGPWKTTLRCWHWYSRRTIMCLRLCTNCKSSFQNYLQRCFYVLCLLIACIICCLVERCIIFHYYPLLSIIIHYLLPLSIIIHYYPLLSFIILKVYYPLILSYI